MKREYTDIDVFYLAQDRSFRQWYATAVDPSVDWQAIDDQLEAAYDYENESMTSCAAVDLLRPHLEYFQREVWLPNMLSNDSLEVLCTLIGKEAAIAYDDKLEADGLNQLQRARMMYLAIAEAIAKL